MLCVKWGCLLHLSQRSNAVRSAHHEVKTPVGFTNILQEPSSVIRLVSACCTQPFWSLLDSAPSASPHTPRPGAPNLRAEPRVPHACPLSHTHTCNPSERCVPSAPNVFSPHTSLPFDRNELTPGEHQNWFFKQEQV